MKLRFHRLACCLNGIASIPVSLACATCLVGSAQASLQYYSGASATKTWDTTSTVWGSASGGPYNATWAAGNDACFEVTNTTVTGTAASVHNITFSTTNFIPNTVKSLTAKS